MEIYVGDTDRVYAQGTLTGPVTVDVIRMSDSTTVVTDAIASSEEAGEFFYDFPRALTEQDGTYGVVFTDNADLLTTEYVTVATPYVRPFEFREMFETDATDKEIRHAEAIVRRVIDRYVGQTFSKEHKTVTVYGSVNRIELPGRMYRLNTVFLNGTDVSTNYVWRPDAPSVLDYTFYDYQSIPTFYDIKSDTYYSRLAWHRPGWMQFVVTGDFGWEHVPHDVTLAAGMLVADYLDGENAWREKNLKSLSMEGGQRIEFTAHRGTTGNLNADVLLNKFKETKAFVV